jgi:hypothetical protein
MATAITLISSVTVGSGTAATIDFTSIPQTYTDLLLKFSVRRSSGGVSNIQVTLNSGSTYQGIRLYGGGDYVASDTTSAWGGFISGTGTDNNNTFANNELYIANYTSANKKTWAIESADENNNSNNTLMGFSAQTWNGTGAITSITLTHSNFAQYSTAYLYGISNA